MVKDERQEDEALGPSTLTILNIIQRIESDRRDSLQHSHTIAYSIDISGNFFEQADHDNQATETLAGRLER